MLSFAKLVGDFNPLHLDPDFGKESVFKANIVHGMLAASFFSRIVGIYCPGRNGLYISQNINFRQPIYINDQIMVRATVVKRVDSIRVVTLKTEILKENKIVVDGEAKVKFYE